MARLGVLVLYATGHLNPSVALARALRRRGHDVVFFNVPEVASIITDAGLRFVSFGESAYPPGFLKETVRKIGETSGMEAFTFFLQRMQLLARISFQELPDPIAREQLDLMVVDQLYPGGATLAEHARIPFVSLANAVLLNREDVIPPPSLLWPYDTSRSSIEHNKLGWKGLLAAFDPLAAVVNEQRRAWNLEPYTDFLEDSFSPLAQISQQPPFFDFPRRAAPTTLHFTGPLHDRELARAVPFPWERLDGRPLVYASLGTLQNRQEWIYRAIIEACRSLDAFTVVALGKTGFPPELFDPSPENVLLLSYVPQAELLARASLCITHAGLNTALECLAAGVPSVCLPIASEQPGVAMRMQYVGAGRVVPLPDLNGESLKAAVASVLSDPSYRTAAQKIATQLRSIDGPELASNVIESVLPRATSN